MFFLIKMVNKSMFNVKFYFNLWNGGKFYICRNYYFLYYMYDYICLLMLYL